MRTGKAAAALATAQQERTTPEQSALLCRAWNSRPSMFAAVCGAKLAVRVENVDLDFVLPRGGAGIGARGVVDRGAPCHDRVSATGWAGTIRPYREGCRGVSTPHFLKQFILDS